MRRFFLDSNTISGDTALISGAEAHHLISVLRLPLGTIIELFDGEGQIHRAEITRISSEGASVKILATSQQSQDEQAPLTLALGLLKGKKMDFLVQKATELGVHTFQPLLTRFSEKREVRERQQERWERIMLEACKQCNRPRPMQILPLLDLKDFAGAVASLKLLLWEQERDRPLMNALPERPQSTCLLIGPEGGFHHREVEEAREKGFLTISLGPRTLRAETAAFSAMVLAQFLLGGLHPQDSQHY